MLFDLLVKMLCVLILCPVLLAAVQTLTIDSQLGTSIEDCFERLSIGEQLPPDAIHRNVSELTTRECEQLCKQDKQCQTYDYGVGAKGNATCNLANKNEKELKENNLLLRHPDYDVYVRRFQCEQSPPTPIQAQFDDPGDGPGPAHRPVFRPDEEDPRRPLDDYSPDSRPFETIRPDLIRPIPPYRPPYNNHIDNDRPDDYNSQKPDFDAPPSYGVHKPQDIPYRPHKPQDNDYRPHKPQENPYRLHKPFNDTYKPDPYDILQFQEHYRPPRPLDPGLWRPDPYNPPHLDDDIPDLYGQKPIRPHKPSDFDPYATEKPVYHYIHRPNRKPRPELDSGYGIKPLKPSDYPSKPDPYGHDITHPIGPPDPYRPSYDYPSRPYNKPSYSYNSQYASNYGQSDYQDNSIYVEIYDPPRPYRPPKRPSYGSGQDGYGQNYGYGDQGNYGYGSSHASQSSYGQSQNSHSHYGQGTITEISHHNQDHNRPHDSGYRPQKPSYGNQDSGYGSSDTGYGSQSPSYGSQTQKPNDVTNKPSYGSSQASYGSSSHSDSSYGISGSQYGGGNKPYGNNHDDNQSGYGPQKPNKPNDSNQKPSYGAHGSYGSSQASYGGSSQASYDSHHGSYGGSQGSYGGGSKPSFDGYIEHHDSHHSSHDSSSQSYGVSHVGYGNSRPPSYERPGYGNDRPPYNNDRPAYGHDKPSYDNDRPSYGNNKPSYNNNRPSYGNDKPPYDHDRPSYGNDKPSYEINRPSYGNDKPSYENDRPSYGNKPAYGSDTSYDKPSYGSNKPSYTTERPAYGNHRPPYDSDRPSYGSDVPSYSNRPSYGNDRPSYGSDRPSYDNNRPDPPSNGYGNEFESSGNGYKNTGQGKPSGNQKPRPNETDGYNIKPVYEYELDKPSNVPSYLLGPGGEVITSRPVTIGDYGAGPGMGRDPGYLSYRACFRRVLAGRRALRSFVRKVVPCERLEDCRRECATERRFPCESFNYRLDPSFRGKGLCELMTKPIEAFDIRRDFVEDKDYDFYEVDRNSLEPHCPETLRGSGVLHSGFLSSKPDRIPSYQNQWRDRADWHETRHTNYDRYYEDRRRNHRRRYEDRPYIPYQIGVARSSEADIENWGTYGGYYGGYDSYYKDRSDYFKSINHWRIPADYDRPSGVKTGHNTDFDYYSLGKDKFLESHRYGYGSWKRGRWNSSGSSGLDYGESNYYKKPKPHYYEPAERDDDIPLKDCSSRRRPGMSLGSGAIRRSLLARNVVECEAACFGEREFKCVSYSYRYSNSRGTDNCFLSERPYRGLELSADSGSDVYAMPQDQGCSTVSHRPWIESECFWHVRSGAAVSGAAVRAALTVAGLGACEAECIRAHAFFCRGFSFRFDAPTIGDDLENCILTSSPPTSLETGRGSRPTAGHELYARGNYGRGCEPALYDDVHNRETECYLQYDNAAKLIGAAIKGQAHVHTEQACGQACTDAPFRCLSFSYNNQAPPGTDNCLLSEIRLFDLQRGVDYEHSADDWLFAFDLFNGQCWRKVHGKTDYEEPSPELPRPLTGPGEERYSPGSSPSAPGYPAVPAEPPYIPGSGPPSGPSYKPGYPDKPVYTAPSGPEPSGPGYKPGYLPEPDPPGYLPKPDYKPDFRPSEPSGPGYSGFKPGFRPSEPSGPGYNGYKPGYRPPEPSGPSYPEPSGPTYGMYKPGYRPQPSGPSYLPETGFRPGYPPLDPEPYRPGQRPAYPPLNPEPHRPGQRPYPDQPRPTRPGLGSDREEHGLASVSWRHYTVSGFPCRAGTTCAQNQVAGHWACEPEGGEIGSWDYCCAPTHRCGYSEGFHKPWCYVGSAEDQWRPCSEKYYPYHQHNIPHPSQGHREDQRRPYPNRPHLDRPPVRYEPVRDRPTGPYLPEADRRYWDNLYKNGPQAYYDKYGNPLPGYTRVPTADRPYIKYHHTYPRPGSGTWVPVSPSQQELDPPVPGGLGVPRYWPVAYLHKGPPPNMTYFQYNETKTTTTTENYPRTPIELPRPQRPTEFNKASEKPNDGPEARSHRDEKTRNITDEDIFQISLNNFDKKTTTTTSKAIVKEEDVKVDEEKEIQANKSEVLPKAENVKMDKEIDNLKGIDDKLEDFTSPIEVLDIEDAKTGEKLSDLKTLEAEERQIEAIGRLLASRRGSKLVLEKRSQKDLESKSIAVDKDLVEFNFGNRFPTTERRGIIQKVTKDEIERERNADKSLEVSETTFVRPPRILSTSTTENIRKAIVNGKVFYDATIRDQRDIYSNSTRRSKTFRQLEDSKAPSVIANNNFGKKKIIKTRNVNPVRRVRRVYRKRYNPEEVRRRLLERERSMKMDINDNSKKH